MTIRHALAALALSACAQLVAQQFAAAPKVANLPYARYATSAIAAGDIDGDGDLDLLGGNTSAKSRVYTNRGDARFVDVTANALDDSPIGTTDAHLVDVDGDGDLDALLAALGQDRLYLNNGSGRFVDATTARLPPRDAATSRHAPIDVDNDGDADILIGTAGNAFGDQDRLYVNDGTGTFRDATPGRIPTGNSTTVGFAVADFDGDGDADFVSLDDFDLTRVMGIRVFLNDGTGRFTMQFAPLVDRPRSARFADFDNDRDLDLLVVTQGGVLLFANDGSGAFTDVTAGRIPAALYYVCCAAPLDIDADGDLDLALGRTDTNSSDPDRRQNALLLNDGTARFTDVTTTHLPVDADYTSAVKHGDFDGDGDADIVFASSTHGLQNRVYLNTGAGRFRSAMTSRLPAARDNWTDLALGDVDGDDDPDAVLMQAGGPRLQENDGTGTFTPTATSRMPAIYARAHAMALVDTDVDGDLDIVLACEGQHRLYANDGTGTFTDATATDMPGSRVNGWTLAALDIDGNGAPDLLFGDFRRNVLYVNDGRGRFADRSSRLPPHTQAAAGFGIGDVDRDGDLDVVVANGTDANRLWINGGAGRFTDQTEGRFPHQGVRVYFPRVDFSGSASVALGDVDNDGDVDVVFGSSNRLLDNDGTGRFTDVTEGVLPRVAPLVDIRLEDVDDDGDLDLFSRTVATSVLLVNDGTGTFTLRSDERLGSVDATLAAFGDVDQDGDRDLLVKRRDSVNELLINHQRQLATPWLATLGRQFEFVVTAEPGYASVARTAIPLVAGQLANPPLRTPFGTLFLDVTRLISLPQIAIPAPTGVGRLTYTVPNDPNLVGLRVFYQAFVLEPGASSRAWFTNYCAVVSGR